MRGGVNTGEVLVQQVGEFKTQYSFDKTENYKVQNERWLKQNPSGGVVFPVLFGVCVLTLITCL